MYNFVEKSKELFFQENFLSIYDQQKERLSTFFSESVVKERVSFQLEQTWKSMQNIIQEEVDLVFIEGNKRLSTTELEKLGNEIQLLKTRIGSKHEKDQFKALCSIKWSDAFLDLILKMAKELVNEKAYQSSTLLFHLLTMLKPTIGDFWLGLGISLQEGGSIEEAITIYEIAKELMKNHHPLPLLYLAECFKLMGNGTKARDILKDALTLIETDEKFKKFQSEALRLQNLI